MDGSERYLNRELSLLDFQSRVLALAENPDLPLLERVKFVAIVSNNLDEFFQVRVAGLRNQEAAGGGHSVDGRTPAEQLAEIRPKIDALNARIDRVFAAELDPALTGAGIDIMDWKALDADDRDHLGQVFEEQIFPVLTPLAVDPSHPFPFISNLSLNLGVVTRNPNRMGTQFARIKLPPVLPRFIQLPDQARFVKLEELIEANLHRLFGGQEIIDFYTFRVTRSADFAVEEDEADDLLEAMESVLRFRQRAAEAVRLEIEAEMPDQILELLLRELDLGPADVYRHESPLNLAGLFAIYELDRPELKYEPFTPVTQPQFRSSPGQIVDFFALLSEGDHLVHYPYESFATSTGAFLAQAAADPDVVAIKQTLYRTSASDDPALGGEEAIVESLIRAAEAGKQVVVLVELKARFDEAANIEWARLLEKAGAHVVYGVSGLKTHSKILLVVRREDGKLRRYSNIGTGNYNPKTARIYEDMALFTADHDLGADLSELFNALTGYSVTEGYRKLLVAPVTMRERLIARIREEASHGREGHILWKLNHLLDREIIDELYAASDAGCNVDLVVRGVCSLRAGVPGLSDNITVRSIVGRYLEHSRIYRFGRPASGAVYYIGSADMMPRNLNGRVECLTPVTDPRLKMRIEEVLQVMLADDVLAWQMDGMSWDKVPTSEGVNSQDELQQLAIARGASAG